MKAVLTRFTPYKGIGLYIGEHELFVSRIASTPFGVSEIGRASQPYEPEKLGETVARLIAPFAGARKRMCFVSVGLAARRVFYSTRPVRVEGEPSAAQTLLREMLQSPNVCIDEMTAQMQVAEFGKSKLASVGSCRTDYLKELLKTLERAGVRPLRTEPAPLALLRAGVQKRRVRRGTVAIRLFLSDHEAIAVVTAGATCVLWKTFSLAKGRELPTLCSTIRSCQATAARCGALAQPDVAIVHGRQDLRELITSEEFGKKAGVAVVWCEGPELCGATIAYGLALSCVTQQIGEGLDLARSLTPAPSLWRIFPWGELALETALVACMGLVMLSHWRSVNEMEGPMRTELAKHKWFGSKTQADLNKEQQFLSAHVDAIRKFAGTRAVWTKYTPEVSALTPEGAKLTGFQGFCEIEDAKSKIKAKKSLLIRGQVPVPADGSTPKQIDRLLTGLQTSPVVAGTFPEVTLSDIKCPPVVKRDESPKAYFTVLCLPKASGPAAASKGDSAGKEEH